MRQSIAEAHFTEEQLTNIRETALSEDRLNPTTHLMEAGVRRSRGEMEACYLHLAITLALDPENYAALNMLARQLARDGSKDIAAALLDRSWLIQKRSVPKCDQAAVYSQNRAMLENP
jgi:hypothetical protein